MNLLIFRTDIKTKKKVKTIKPILDNAPNIYKWNIDLDDIDNVLRIEALYGITEDDIIKLVKSQGFYCEDLEE